MKLFQKRKRQTVVYSEASKHHASDPVLLAEIEKVKLDMENAYTNFQNVVDPDLIDCYIFEGNAALKRYHFLLKQVKAV